MPQGNYDHPSYLTRQMMTLGKTTAGANGTNVLGFFSFPFAVRARQLVAVTEVAGTTAGHTASLVSVSGTTTTTGGALTLSTATINQVSVSTDMNFAIPANALCYILNGTDATGTENLFLHYHIDPAVGTWTGV